MIFPERSGPGYLFFQILAQMLPFLRAFIEDIKKKSIPQPPKSDSLGLFPALFYSVTHAITFYLAYLITYCVLSTSPHQTVSSRGRDSDSFAHLLCSSRPHQFLGRISVSGCWRTEWRNGDMKSEDIQCPPWQGARRISFEWYGEKHMSRRSWPEVT